MQLDDTDVILGDLDDVPADGLFEVPKPYHPGVFAGPAHRPYDKVIHRR